MPTRRRFLKLATAGGAAACLTPKWVSWAAAPSQIPGGTLPPGVIQKFVTPLLIPPAMPLSGSSAMTDHYTIGVRQFAQQILPAPHRRTTVWGYGSLTNPATFNSPSLTIEAQANRQVEVTWVNQLVDAGGVVRPPEAWETGLKDTVISYPGEITRVKATFDRAGQFVWHCHILEHEDNEMMRPYSVGPVQNPAQ